MDGSTSIYQASSVGKHECAWLCRGGEERERKRGRDGGRGGGGKGMHRQMFLILLETQLRGLLCRFEGRVQGDHFVGYINV